MSETKVTQRGANVTTPPALNTTGPACSPTMRLAS